MECSTGPPTYGQVGARGRAARGVRPSRSASVGDDAATTRAVADDRGERLRSATQPAHEQPPRRAADRPSTHFAASQSGPMPASTASGGSISNAPAICSLAISLDLLGLVGGPLEQQLVVDLEDQTRVCSPAASSAWSQRTIATFMMSAAVPWITMLTANRSPCLRSSQRRARSSGTWRRRPNSVET